MEKKFLQYLKEPGTGNGLQLVEFNSEGENIVDAVLISSTAAKLYPIVKGVPVMLEQGLSAAFLSKYKTKLDELKSKYPSLNIYEDTTSSSWSFSLEWEHHTEDKMVKTWGLTLPERFAIFLHENQVAEAQLPSMLLLDAGCGNGMQTEDIANHGGTVIGLDFSDSPFIAEARRKSKNVCFIKGDLQNPPFTTCTFDLVFSSGVIHHTSNTYSTFKSIAKIVKPGGKLYVWLYNRQGNILWRIKRRFFDFLRMVVCRFPDKLQVASVNLLTSILYFGLKMGGSKREYGDVRLAMYDSITPRWRHYHEPLEVRQWYFEQGFTNLLISNWNDLYGYGMIGTKESK